MNLYITRIGIALTLMSAAIPTSAETDSDSAGGAHILNEKALTPKGDAAHSDTLNIFDLAEQMSLQLEENEVQTELALNRHRLRSMKWMITLMSCILILVVIWLHTSRKHSRERKKSNEILRDHEHELEAYNEELCATNEELTIINEELQHTQDELDKYRHHLEELVEEKTSELKNALVKAQESDRLKEAFLSNMSHEIRTPLNAILGFLPFINDPDTTPDKHQEFVDMINANAHQLLTTITDIVTLSKADSLMLECRSEKTDINRLLDGVRAEGAQLLRYSGKPHLELIVENRLPESIKSVFFAGQYLEHALFHLVDNAIKFTQKGYVLVVSQLQEANNSADQSNNEDECPWMLFSVEDTGIGIAESFKDKIFERFCKQNDLLYRGVGIGLTLAKEMVERMNGFITFKSKEGVGSKFVIKVRGELSKTQSNKS